MTCREYYDFLRAHLDGELAPEVARTFAAHTDDCRACARYLASYRATIALERTLCDDDAGPPADAPEELVQAILAARREL